MDEWLGTGRARVILPITDPYVIHHGALGGLASAYLPDEVDAAALAERIERVDGVECALTRKLACGRFELPTDRIGDPVVISESDHVIGSAPEKHDLSGLDVPLRSDGGLSEQRVPLIVNREAPTRSAERHLRNFDILEVALNHVSIDGRKRSGAIPALKSILCPVNRRSEAGAKGALRAVQLSR